MSPFLGLPCFPCLAIRHVGMTMVQWMTVFRPGFSANWRSVLDFCGFNLAEWWPPSTRRQSMADFSAEWATRCSFDVWRWAILFWCYESIIKLGHPKKKVVSICFSQIFDFGLREYILWPGWLCEGPIPINNFSQTNEIFVLILVTQHKFWTTQRLSRSFPYFSSYCTSPCLIACVAWLCFDIEVGSPGLINRPLKRPMCSMMGCLEMIWTWWGDWGNHETYAGI